MTTFSNLSSAHTPRSKLKINDLIFRERTSLPENCRVIRVRSVSSDSKYSRGQLLIVNTKPQEFNARSEYLCSIDYEKRVGHLHKICDGFAEMLAVESGDSSVKIDLASNDIIGEVISVFQ